jgi:hypothetical protein
VKQESSLWKGKENLLVRDSGRFRSQHEQRRFLERVPDLLRNVSDRWAKKKNAREVPGRSKPAGRIGSNYFGCGTIRKYGLGDFQPPGYFFAASSFDTEPLMITSSPGFQFAGVDTWCFAVS